MALTRGEPLLVLFDFELYDAAGALTATHFLGLGNHVPTPSDLAPAAARQYRDRFVSGAAAVQLFEPFGSGRGRATGAVRFANPDGGLDFLRAAFLSAASAQLAVRFGAPGLDWSDFEIRHRLGVVDVRHDQDLLVIDLGSNAADLERTRVPVELYLGLGQAVNPEAGGLLTVPSNGVLDPDGGFLIEMFLYLPTTPAVETYELARRWPASFQWRLTLAPTTRQIVLEVRNDLGSLQSLTTDLVMPVGRWVSVGMYWDGSTVIGLLDGQISSSSIALTSILDASGEVLTFSSATAAQRIPGYVTELRFSNAPPSLAIIQARARRPVTDDELAEYSFVYRTQELGLVDLKTIYDATANALDATFAADVAWLPSYTGTAALAGEVIPRLFGWSLDLEGVAVEASSARRRFCMGPIASLSRIELEGYDRHLWQSVVRAVDGQFDGTIFTLDDDLSLDVACFQAGQTVEVDDGTTVYTREVAGATAYEVRFVAETPNPTPPITTKPWTIRTVAPRAQLAVGSVHFHGTAKEIEAANGFFRHRHAQQTVTVGNTASNDGAFTIALEPEEPYRTIVVEETVVEETPAATDFTWAQFYDGTSDETLATFELVIPSAGEMTAEVHGPGLPDEPTIFADVAALAGRTAADLAESISTGGMGSLGHGVGLLVARADLTIADALSQILASVDGSWDALPDDPDLFATRLQPPDEIEVFELVDVLRLQAVEPFPPFPAIDVLWGRRGASSEYRQVTRPVGTTALPASRVQLQTLEVRSIGAEQRGDLVLANRSIEDDERRGFRIEVPIYDLPRLLSMLNQTCTVPQVAELAGSRYRVVGVGWDIPASGFPVAVAVLWG